MNTNHQSQPDVLDRAIDALRAMPIPPSLADDELLLQLNEASRPRMFSTLLNRIKTMPRSLRYSLVASLAVVALLFVLNQGKQNLALADVTEAVGEYKIVRYQEQMDMIDGPTVQNVITLDMSLDHLRIGSDARRRCCHQHHGFSESDYVGTLSESEHGLSNAHGCDTQGRRSFLDVIRQLQDNPETIRTAEDLDGVPAIVFRLTTNEETRDDLEGYEGVPVGGPFRTTIWVDPETSLPLMIENFYKGPSGDRFMIDSQFEWDPEVADDVFSTNPPAGYVLQEVPAAEPPADE